MNHRDTEDTEFTIEQLNELSGRVIGSAIEVHRHLGPGFLESVYEEALAIQLALDGIDFRRQVENSVFYKGRRVGQPRIDLLVSGQLVIELKAVESTLPIHFAQVLSYLKAGSFQLGLLINFNVVQLRKGIHRLVWDSTTQKFRSL